MFFEAAYNHTVTAVEMLLHFIIRTLHLSVNMLLAGTR